ncbi:MAG TPA: hypothetical protein DCW76_02080 [Lysinibacillus sp.]|nr:hypothetical protein [Lysinibacillus sp.]
MTKPKRKKRNKKIKLSEEFRNLKGPKRECLIASRKAKELTQTQLGKLVGCSAAMIAHLENGRVNPSLDISMQIEQVLEKSFFELFPDL